MNDYSAVIGQNITELRKKHNMTQEQLGALVGVSGQAVSKWEKGGMPDAYLLPEIAKVFDVSIDSLFNCERKKDLSAEDVFDTIYKYSVDNNLDGKEYIDFIFECIWSAQNVMCSSNRRLTLDEIIEYNSNMGSVTSQVIRDAGTTYMSFEKGLTFYFAVKEDPAISEKLLNTPEISELFGLLADKDGLNSVIYTQVQSFFDANNKYTETAIAEKIGISVEKFRKIVPLLVKYNLLCEERILVDGKELVTYHSWMKSEVRQLLLMSYMLVTTGQCYYNYTCNRRIPYFDLSKKK